MYKLPVRALACATVIGLSQMPTAFAEPYGLLNGRSMNYIDGMGFGAGYRHFLD